MRIHAFAMFTCLVLVSTSCSTYRVEKNPVRDMAIETGVAGTVVGAGTGAAIGAVITNGDVLGSALLGAGVGLPVGVIAGILYAKHLQEKEIEMYQTEIDENARVIRARQIEVETLRKRLDHESRNINLNVQDRRNLYEGPSIGVYYR